MKSTALKKTLQATGYSPNTNKQKNILKKCYFALGLNI